METWLPTQPYVDPTYVENYFARRILPIIIEIFRIVGTPLGIPVAHFPILVLSVVVISIIFLFPC